MLPTPIFLIQDCNLGGFEVMIIILNHCSGRATSAMTKFLNDTEICFAIFLITKSKACINKIFSRGLKAFVLREIELVLPERKSCGTFFFGQV
jgi:Tfp pilus assembly ATPase PilU